MEAKIIHTDVLIVGAGPTGLMAANQLARFGIEPIIIDKKEGPTRESRAIAVTARSLEVYQQMGIAKHAIKEGKTIESFNIYSDGKPRAEVRIGEIGRGLSEFSYMLAFEQSKNETLLSDHFTGQGYNIFWNHEFLEILEHRENIHIRVKNGDRILDIKAKYLIGCDGAGSLIRQQLDFSFHGGTYKHKFFVADTEMYWDYDYQRLVLTPGDKNFCGFFPIYGERNYRVIGTLPKEYFNREDISFNDIEEVVKDTAGLEMVFRKVNWFSIYKLHHRRVEHFRKGRVFLAGDSAHIHSPAGGQGMNTGLQDAYNLCWKLALVLNQKAKPILLDTYNEERLPFAKWLLGFTDRGFNMMTSDHWLIRFVRKNVALKLMKFFLSASSIKSFAFRTISQTGYSYYNRSLSASATRQKLKFRPGDRLPFFPEENLYPQFTQASFHLLHICEEPLGQNIRQQALGLFPFDLRIIEDKKTAKWKELGVLKQLFILVRPDNYMAFIFDSFNSMVIRKYLDQYFSPNPDE